MAKVLLIGGCADGEAHVLPEHLARQHVRDIRWTVPARPKIPNWDPALPISQIEPPGPSVARHSVYRVVELHMARLDRTGHDVVRFAHEVDMSPSEALVMLMQFYQNKPEQS